MTQISMKKIQTTIDNIGTEIYNLRNHINAAQGQLSYLLEVTGRLQCEIDNLKGVKPKPKIIKRNKDG